MEPKLIFDTVSERDMDLLFAKVMSCDIEFLKIFLSRAVITGNNINLLSIELSKMNSDGESDITAICEVNGIKYGLLIEDKIDAIAMPAQCERYFLRGNTGIKNGDYADFKVFMIAPENYHSNNDEAKKYPYYISYEECKAYFESKNDSIYKIYNQQIKQAINKSKHVSQVIFDKDKNAFLRKYVEYQRNIFPMLECTANLDRASKGWVEFKTPLNDVRIIHKHDKDFMDLEFSNSESFRDNLLIIQNELKNLNIDNVIAVPTGKSYCFRINVPHITFDDEFNHETMDKLNGCFNAAEKLLSIAKIMFYSNII